MDKDAKACCYVVCCFIPVILIGFGVSMLAIETRGTRYYPEASCSKFPSNLTTINATLSRGWHSGYEFHAPLQGSFQQTCPSTYAREEIMDADVFLNGRLVARSERKTFTNGQLKALSERQFFSSVSEVLIKDCGGNHYMTMRTGGFYEPLSSIGVSMQLTDMNDTVLAYVEGDNFFTDDINVMDYDTRERLANLHRNTRDLDLNTDWTWDFTINDPGHPAVSLEILSIMAGIRDTPDSCNAYFVGVDYIFLCAGILIVSSIVALIIWKYKFCVEKIFDDLFKVTEQNNDLFSSGAVGETTTDETTNAQSF